MSILRLTAIEQAHDLLTRVCEVSREMIIQTFLPYPDFRASLECLDSKRLGNQVYREGLTLLRGHWSSHPASRMWRGHRPSLALYLLVGLDVLEERGTPYDHHRGEIQVALNDEPVPPYWLGDERVHASHRSNLLRKDPTHYGQFGWTESPDLPYYWPTS